MSDPIFRSIHLEDKTLLNAKRIDIILNLFILLLCCIGAGAAGQWIKVRVRESYLYALFVVC